MGVSERRLVCVGAGRDGLRFVAARSSVGLAREAPAASGGLSQDLPSDRRPVAVWLNRGLVPFRRVSKSACRPWLFPLTTETEHADDHRSGSAQELAHDPATDTPVASVRIDASLTDIGS